MLNNYLWKKRILIIFQDDSNTAEQQRKIIDKDIQEMLERDIIVIGFGKFNDNLYERYMDLEKIREEYSISNKDKIVLIGKDGSIKKKWNKPVSTDKLFSIIDAMPMRKAEMRKKNE